MANQYVDPFEYVSVGNVLVYDPNCLLRLKETDRTLQRDYGFVPPYPPPLAVQARDSKALPPLPGFARTHQSYAPRTPTSTSPSTLVGSPPSSVRTSTFEEKPTSKSTGSNIKAFLTPEWGLKKDATEAEVRMHKYGVLGKLAVDLIEGLFRAIKVLAKVAVPGLYWDRTPSEAAQDKESPKGLESPWRSMPGHLSSEELPLRLPPQTACPHGPSICNDCTRADLVYRHDYACEAFVHNLRVYRSHQRAAEEPAVPPEKKENWLCKHIVWNQK
ncbi:hypothetical protein QFC20_003744 [Naganishia adeliensis]|uniref:Uncharacterized protein n=1 Tax=Naganishia adeliensis TaxID=92952 RepID=A0ACC2W7M2_9TREE|nr:hypothetical protein QFC20_003744 [Naganishia adeliensis]